MMAMNKMKFPCSMNASNCFLSCIISLKGCTIYNIIHPESARPSGLSSEYKIQRSGVQISLSVEEVTDDRVVRAGISVT